LSQSPNVPEVLGLPPDLPVRPFAEPWQAQAFALAVGLHQAGLFTWPEWVERLAAEIRTAPQQPGECAEDAYHRQWLAALEQFVVERAACQPEQIDLRQAAWREAYLRTPHGQPVELANAELPEPAHHNHDDHDHLPRPIAVASARLR